MEPERIDASLASSLLNAELEADRIVSRSGGSLWKTGIRTVDNALPHQLWTGEHTIGIGEFADTTVMKSSSTPSLPSEIVTTHLLTSSDHPHPQQSTSSVFILCPPTQTTSTIHRLHSNLLRPNPHLSRRKLDPKTLLEHVSLLQYLDISGLLESLTEVTASITSIRPQGQVQRCVLLIQGLTVTLAAMQRRNGTVQTAAMLTSVGQALSALKRAAGGLCLCLVELDLVRRGGGESEKEKSRGNSALQTAFAVKEAGEMRLDVHPVLRDLLQRMMDSVVVVHDAGGKMEGKVKVVEVVKDERLVGLDDGGTGEAICSALGRWTVWK